MENKEPKWYERLSEEERRKELKKDCKTCGIMIVVGTIILLLSLLKCATSCDSASINEEPAQNESLYWETRHDAIPKSMQGEWVSVSDKTEIVLIVTDRFVMTEHFSIDREQDNVVRVNDSILQMYQNGKFYALAFGSNGALTITADNDCYDTLVPFQQQQTNLN